MPTAIHRLDCCRVLVQHLCGQVVTDFEDLTGVLSAFAAGRSGVDDLLVGLRLDGANLEDE